MVVASVDFTDYFGTVFILPTVQSIVLKEPAEACFEITAAAGVQYEAVCSLFITLYADAGAQESSMAGTNPMSAAFLSH